jgi:uncharacterized sulfatase
MEDGMNGLQRMLAALLAAVGGAAAVAAEAPRPNILWITTEDIGPELGCYGDTYAQTPNLDALAARGLRYLHAWSTAPVCAPARTTLISGMYPPCLGAEHMRSEVAPPPFFRMYPQLLRERGYYCSNNSKEDYNLAKPGQVWDDSSGKAHWRNRREGQPFFAIFNFTITHESQIRKRPHTWIHDPAKAPVPAYHPDTPEVRQDWAQYYDNITTMDGQAGKVLAELQADGLEEDTIVFFYGDHGSGMPRSKRWPYNSGLHVALIVHVPEKYKALAPPDYRAGGTTDRLVGFVDFAPSLASLAGMKPPDWMQGRAFMGAHTAPPPKFQHGFRGRMDERYDLVRSVTDGRYVYLRQYMPHLIYGQHIDYMFQTPTTRLWKEMYDAGKLKAPQTHFWERKPPEELYDLQADPDETRNLAGSPEHRVMLETLRKAQRDHALAIRDVGLLSEAEFHRRAAAAGVSIYEFGHDADKYPLERILDMADAATLGEAGAEPRLKQGLKDPDSGVRYWAVMGFLIRGAGAVSGARAELAAALKDESPTVRVIAARALGEYGGEAGLALALPVLRDHASPVENGAYLSMLALNAVDALGPKAASLKEIVRALPLQDPKAAGRANGYVARLVQTITGAAPAAKPPRPRTKERSAKPAGTGG